MVQLIVGKKGKGKTKCLLDRVNTEVRTFLEISLFWIRIPNICMN